VYCPAYLQNKTCENVVQDAIPNRGHYNDRKSGTEMPEARVGLRALVPQRSQSLLGKRTAEDQRNELAKHGNAVEQDNTDCLPLHSLSSFAAGFIEAGQGKESERTNGPKAGKLIRPGRNEAVLHGRPAETINESGAR